MWITGLEGVRLDIFRKTGRGGKEKIHRSGDDEKQDRHWPECVTCKEPGENSVMNWHFKWNWIERRTKRRRRWIKAFISSRQTGERSAHCCFPRPDSGADLWPLIGWGRGSGGTRPIRRFPPEPAGPAERLKPSGRNPLTLVVTVLRPSFRGCSFHAMLARRHDTRSNYSFSRAKPKTKSQPPVIPPSCGHHRRACLRWGKMCTICLSSFLTGWFGPGEHAVSSRASGPQSSQHPSIFRAESAPELIQSDQSAPGPG